MSTKAFLIKFNQTTTVEGQNLINEFFIAFSRFECALKETGFVSGNDVSVSPNWDTFIVSIKSAFENDQNKTTPVINAIEYLTTNSPRIQNIVNQQLGWRERVFPENTPVINKLSLSIRDIRNNLFHGGKFNGNYQEDVSRNFILLRHSTEILNYWLRLSPPVKENFLKSIT